jgi:acetyl/propionyl-CoA carboxylase alpha subunit
VRAGDAVGADYDAMIAKVIAHGENRGAALGRLAAALAGTHLGGPRTNQAFVMRLIGEGSFVSGTLDTGLIEARLDALLDGLDDPDPAMLAAGAEAVLAAAGRAWAERGPAPWAASDGFQLGPRRALDLAVLADGRPVMVAVRWAEGGAAVEGGDAVAAEDLLIAPTPSGVVVTGNGRQLHVGLPDPFAAAAARPAEAALTAPMPGRIAEIAVADGAVAAAGDALMVLEAMKMEHVIRAPRAGRVRLAVAAGEQVEMGAPLAEIEAPAEAAEG